MSWTKLAVAKNLSNGEESGMFGSVPFLPVGGRSEVLIQSEIVKKTKKKKKQQEVRFLYGRTRCDMQGAKRNPPPQKR